MVESYSSPVLPFYLSTLRWYPIFAMKKFHHLIGLCAIYSNSSSLSYHARVSLIHHFCAWSNNIRDYKHNIT